jgi:ectoine hydroxylase
MTNAFRLDDEQIQRFNDDGFLIAKSLLDPEETRLLHDIAHADHQLEQEAASRRDGGGGAIRLSVHNTLGEDIYAAIVRSRRIVETMERLLGGEVYHYHHKMILKEPFVGGAWEWHQDYGYWYHNGCLYPDMASCYIAVDRAHRGNGCLQVIRGSHRLGRIEHGTYGGQTGADPARTGLALQHLERIYCEMEPGDALFFHANLLHRSDQNRSDDPRWSLICCYNTRHNPCENRPGHPSYTPLEKWEDSRIKELGRRQWAALQAGGG